MITLRPIIVEDAEDFAKLRNGDDTYLWFYSKKKFSVQDVEKWLTSHAQSSDPNKDLMFVAEIDGETVGTCSAHDVDINNRKTEVGRIIISESMRGQGLGTDILEQLVDMCFQKGFTLLYANIMKDNISSQRIFEKVGFKKTQERPDTGLYYELRREENGRDSLI